MSQQWLCKKCGSINNGPDCFKCGPAQPIHQQAARVAGQVVAPYAAAVRPYRANTAHWWRSMPPVKRIGVVIIGIVVVLFTANQILDLGTKLEFRAEKMRAEFKAEADARENKRRSEEWERQYEAHYREYLAPKSKPSKPAVKPNPALTPPPTYDYSGREIKPGEKPQEKAPNVAWGSQGR